MRKWQLCQENQLQRKKREKKQFLKWEIHSQIFSLHVFACFLDVKETSLEVSENDTMFVCLFSPLYYQVNHKLEPRLWREKTQRYQDTCNYYPAQSFDLLSPFSPLLSLSPPQFSASSSFYFICHSSFLFLPFSSLSSPSFLFAIQVQNIYSQDNLRLLSLGLNNCWETTLQYQLQPSLKICYCTKATLDTISTLLIYI